MNNLFTGGVTLAVLPYLILTTTTTTTKPFKLEMTVMSLILLMRKQPWTLLSGMVSGGEEFSPDQPLDSAAAHASHHHKRINEGTNP